VTRQRRWWRVPAVLVLLAGLLAMHGLANVHHDAGPVLAAGQHGDASADHHGSEALGGVVPAAISGCDETCQEQAHGVLLLCLALLVAALVVLTVPALLRGRLRTALRPPGRFPPRVLRVPRRRVDLVADLCVSRT
jgi:hypothetical protein